MPTRAASILNAKPRESLQYIMEVAWQRGRVGAEDLQAFYGLWKVVAKPFRNESLPGVVAEHSYARGDGRPGDGKVQTFEPLYPRLHPIWGIADQLAGRNLHNLWALNGHFQEKPPSSAITIFFGLQAAMTEFMREMAACWCRRSPVAQRNRISGVRLTFNHPQV
jgi:hypothetical protein